MATNWIYGIRSVGFARESAYGTENTTDGDFMFMPAEIAPPNLARKTEDLKFATGQAGAFEPPVVGGKHGSTFTLKFPIRTYKSGYAAATDSILTAGVMAPEFLLLALALGSNAAGVTSAAELKQGKHLIRQPYAAGDIAAGGTTSAVNVQGGSGANYAAGRLLAASTNTSSTNMQRGWIKSIATDALTLFEAAGGAISGNSYTAAAGDAVWQSGTAYLSDQTQIPFTLRITGNHTTQKLAMVGCVCTGWKLSMKAGEQLMCELTCVATDYNQYATGGQLWTYGAFNRLSPILGGYRDGRLTFGDTASGGAAYDGFNELSVDCQYTMAYIPSHNKQQGVVAAIVTDRKVHIGCSVPFDSSASFSSGLPTWDYAFENGVSKCLSLFVGDRPGQVFSAFFPALHLVSQPGLKDEGGLLYHTLNFRPSTYSADGTSTSVEADTTAADALVRFGVA